MKIAPYSRSQRLKPPILSALTKARLKPCLPKPLFLSSSLGGHHTTQENVSHFVCDRCRVGIDARIVPGIDPIHHAEQAQHCETSRELPPTLALQIVEQPHADSVVFPLDGRNFRA